MPERTFNMATTKTMERGGVGMAGMMGSTNGGSMPGMMGMPSTMGAMGMMGMGMGMSASAGTMPSGMMNMMMVPRCKMTFEKCEGGMKIMCVCEDKISVAMMQNLC